MTDPFRSFYRTHPPDLSPISDLTHRHFRILLPRGMFFKIPARIRDGKILQEWLVRYRPSDVYYSTGCWLAPERLGRREKTPLADNIFLASDIVFDIDREPFSYENLESARNDTLRILDFCRDESLPVRYIAFSGSKGFHVVCSDTVRYPAADPGEREDLAKERRRMILERLTATGITVDRRVTPDTRRIIRVPGTINSKTGYLCTVLTEKELGWPVAKILKSIPRITLRTPLIPVPGDDHSLRDARIISWLCHRFGARSEPHPSVSFSTFLVNSVPGTALQVPVFVYPPWKERDAVEQELRRLQETYGLSDIYLFYSETGFAAICLRTFPLNRLEKILVNSTSTGTAALLRYHQLFFRVGRSADASGRTCAGAPEFIGTLAADPRSNERFISRPHYDFMAGFIPLPEYPRLHGRGAVRLIHAVIGNG